MKVTATLTRLHKIEERFKAKRTELRHKINRLVQFKHVVLTKGMLEVPVDNEATTEEALSLLQDVHTMSGVISDIRSLIAAKNVELGISAMLSEYNEQLQLKGIVTQILAFNSAREGSDSVDCETVLQSLNESDSESQQVSVDVSGIHSDYLKSVEDILEKYEARINELSDLISDKNKEKVVIEIPEKFKTLVGVAK